MPVAAPTAAPVPPPSKVVLLLNMLDSSCEIDEALHREVAKEGQRFGRVTRVHAARVAGNAIRVFVVFDSPDSAKARTVEEGGGGGRGC